MIPYFTLNNFKKSERWKHLYIYIFVNILSITRITRTSHHFRNLKRLLLISIGFKALPMDIPHSWFLSVPSELSLP